MGEQVNDYLPPLPRAGVEAPRLPEDPFEAASDDPKSGRFRLFTLAYRTNLIGFAVGAGFALVLAGVIVVSTLRSSEPPAVVAVEASSASTDQQVADVPASVDEPEPAVVQVAPTGSADNAFSTEQAVNVAFGEGAGLVSWNVEVGVPEANGSTPLPLQEAVLGTVSASFEVDAKLVESARSYSVFEGVEWVIIGGATGKVYPVSIVDFACNELVVNPPNLGGILGSVVRFMGCASLDANDAGSDATMIRLTPLDGEPVHFGLMTGSVVISEPKAVQAPERYTSSEYVLTLNEYARQDTGSDELPMGRATVEFEVIGQTPADWTKVTLGIFSGESKTFEDRRCEEINRGWQGKRWQGCVRVLRAALDHPDSAVMVLFDGLPVLVEPIAAPS